MYLLCVWERVAVLTVVWRSEDNEQVLSSHQAGFWDPPELPGLTARALLAQPPHWPCLSFLKLHPQIPYSMSQVSFDAVQSGLCVLRSWWEAAWFLGSLCARGQKTSSKDRESQIDSMCPEPTLTHNVLPFHQVPLDAWQEQDLPRARFHSRPLNDSLDLLSLPPKHIPCSNIRLE